MNGPANAGNKACVDSSQLALAIFGAIFGTLALCTGFAFAIWYLVRNHQLDKLLFLGRRMRGNHHQHSSKNKEEADIKTEVDCPCPRNYASVETITNTAAKIKKKRISKQKSIVHVHEITHLLKPSPTQQQK